MSKKIKESPQFQVGRHYRQIPTKNNAELGTVENYLKPDVERYMLFIDIRTGARAGRAGDHVHCRDHDPRGLGRGHDYFIPLNQFDPTDCLEDK